MPIRELRPSVIHLGLVACCAGCSDYHAVTPPWMQAPQFRDSVAYNDDGDPEELSYGDPEFSTSEVKSNDFGAKDDYRPPSYDNSGASAPSAEAPYGQGDGTSGSGATTDPWTGGSTSPSDGAAPAEQPAYGGGSSAGSDLPGSDYPAGGSPGSDLPATNGSDPYPSDSGSVPAFSGDIPDASGSAGLPADFPSLDLDPNSRFSEALIEPADFVDYHNMVVVVHSPYGADWAKDARAELGNLAVRLPDGNSLEVISDTVETDPISGFAPAPDSITLTMGRAFTRDPSIVYLLTESSLAYDEVELIKAANTRSVPVRVLSLTLTSLYTNDELTRFYEIANGGGIRQITHKGVTIDYFNPNPTP